MKKEMEKKRMVKKQVVKIYVACMHIFNIKTSVIDFSTDFDNEHIIKIKINNYFNSLYFIFCKG